MRAITPGRVGGAARARTRWALRSRRRRGRRPSPWRKQGAFCSGRPLGPTASTAARRTWEQNGAEGCCNRALERSKSGARKACLGVCGSFLLWHVLFHVRPVRKSGDVGPSIFDSTPSSAPPPSLIVLLSARLRHGGRDDDAAGCARGDIGRRRRPACPRGRCDWTVMCAADAAKLLAHPRCLLLRSPRLDGPPRACGRRRFGVRCRCAAASRPSSGPWKVPPPPAHDPPDPLGRAPFYRIHLFFLSPLPGREAWNRRGGVETCPLLTSLRCARACPPCRTQREGGESGP